MHVHSKDYSLLEKAHSRMDQRYTRTRSIFRTSGVDQGCLNDSTISAAKYTIPWRIKSMIYKRSLRMTILACLQVTRNTTGQQYQPSITNNEQVTYAMAEVRGPLDK